MTANATDVYVKGKKLLYLKIDNEINKLWSDHSS